MMPFLNLFRWKIVVCEKDMEGDVFPDECALFQIQTLSETLKDCCEVTNAKIILSNYKKGKFCVYSCPLLSLPKRGRNGLTMAGDTYGDPAVFLHNKYANFFYYKRNGNGKKDREWEWERERERNPSELRRLT
jgi:hypothetical protein